LTITAGSFQNPVFPEPFPDPFVLKFCGEYFAYCTGFARDGLAVGVARSTDLVSWSYVGGALTPIDSQPPYYWAPEVVYHNGRFYMYYSCGNETLMEIRVAVSDRPDQGFVDSGRRLTFEEFAIDAHVFTDDDGRRYMFYATDFLTHSHIGTGTVVDRMVSLFELEGNPKPVSRAAYDWQVYDPQRIEKGGVRWHTVEGPTVFKFKRKYFEMFSGGNWQNSSYGVGYATSGTLEDAGEWHQSIDGSSVLPVLRTIPEKVIGPGHNSAAIGPNGRELYCVYHCWQGSDRVMAIDRMGFAGERLFVNGATFTPQLAPLPPAITTDSTEWEFNGDWRRAPNGFSNFSRNAKVSVPTGGTCFLAEMSFRLTEVPTADSEIRFGGTFGELPVFELRVSPHDGKLYFIDRLSAEIPLPETLDFAAFQHLSIDLDGHFVKIRLNGLPLAVTTSIELTCDRLFIVTRNASMEVRGATVTPGYEDRFECDGYVPANAGWKVMGRAELEISSDELMIRNTVDGEAFIWKGEPAVSFEFAANIRAAAPGSTGFGFAILDKNGQISRRFLVERLHGGLFLSDTLTGTYVPLPSSYKEENHRQFRFLKIGPLLRVESEECLLCELEVDSKPAIVGIFTIGASVAVEMVRWTPLMHLEGDSN
jgi:GH43 family beta-xylosidase